MKPEFAIYALFDPREPNVWRYIGATAYPIKERLSGHISDAKSSRKRNGKVKPRQAWILSLLENGLKPGIVELDRCDCFEVESREIEWIVRFESTGKLLNVGAFRCPYNAQHRGIPGLSREKVIEELQRREAKALQIMNWPYTTKTKLTDLQRKLST